MKTKYTVEEIKEAVDIVIGDDGRKSDEVIRILSLIARSNLILDRIVL